MKKLAGLCLFVSVLFSSLLFSQEEKVRVKVDRASIYAEADTSSYRIEVLNRGAVLILFGGRQSKEGWWYMYYQSPRWKSKVTGFVQMELVERSGSEDEKPVAVAKELKADIKAVAEKKEPAKAKPIEVKPVEIMREPIKIKPVKIDRSIAIVSLPSSRKYDLPGETGLGEKPRLFPIPEKVEPEPEEQPAKVEVVTFEELDVVALQSGMNYALPRFGEFQTETLVIEIPKKPAPKQKPEEQELQREVKRLPEFTTMKPPTKRGLFTMSLGFGPSLGGLGSFIQVNTESGFSLHGGVGYYPTSLFYPEFNWVEGKMMFSVGIKYYLPRATNQVRPYVDLQYGGVSVEAIRVVTGISYYATVYENLQKILWGPSLLGGIEVRFGPFGLNSALGISYILTRWDYWDQSVLLIADIGLLFYF